MNKINIIIKREYFTRVKKKSFIVMTFVVPILFLALVFIPAILSQKALTVSKVLVVDQTLVEKNGVKSSLFLNKFKNNDELTFVYGYDIKKAQDDLIKKEYDAVLELVKTNDNPPIKGFLYYGENELSLVSQQAIQNQLTDIFKNHILTYDYGMSEKDLAWFNDPKIGFYSKNILSGEDSNKGVQTVLSVILGFIIYMFVFMFSSQVMRSISEEKMNRIVEVLVSSIKPIQLLMGKIVAIALVGLTQLLLWGVFFAIMIFSLQGIYPDAFNSSKNENITITQKVPASASFNEAIAENSEINKIIQQVFSINYGLVLSTFLFYFLAGYFLYAALFGAVGALVDVDTDVQQFTLPITIPLIIAMVCFPLIINSPSGGVAFWLSIIPLTSPMVMMMRIPFGVPAWELILSMAVMIIFIAFCVYIAAKIYRTGILMYGKNITYKEVWKWLKYKN
ncbi:MAG: ABC transporter permease [Bacteroidales bacterium]|jgi:ABC-2 type transport system permease protein|nr:ABC transporter permease [Bacteroidales bacterium]